MTDPISQARATRRERRTWAAIATVLFVTAVAVDPHGRYAIAAFVCVLACGAYTWIRFTTWRESKGIGHSGRRWDGSDR